MHELAVIYQIGDKSAGDKVAGLIKQADGQIKHETTWEERDLAYPIKKQTRGIYTFYELDIPGEAVGQLEAGLNITAGVLRHLVTKIDHKAKAKAEAVAQRLASRQTTDSATKTAEGRQVTKT